MVRANRRGLVAGILVVAVIGVALGLRRPGPSPVNPVSSSLPQPELDGGLTSGVVPWDLPLIDGGEVDDITFID